MIFKRWGSHSFGPTLCLARGDFRKVMPLPYLCPMIRFALCLACCLALVGWSKGQDSANPFELKQRLALLAPSSPLDTNPFNVKPHRVPGAALALAENTTKPFRPSSFLPRRGDTLSEQALFWILVGIFTYLTFSVAANRKVVGRAWKGFVNDNGLAVAQREASGFVGLAPYFLLYGNFLLNAGMFIFLLVRNFRRESYNNLLFLVVCILAASAIFLSKHFFLNVARWLFSVEKEIDRYNFLVIIFNCVLGLFLVPFNFLLAFSSESKLFEGYSEEYQQFLPLWILSLVGIFYLYRGLRSLAIGSKILADNKFHFLLYLCAVEFAPLLLLVKLALIQAK
ncbi:MAG: DUF4271 domain-containing protein [Saprospiraceae bacterium]|nr:DUF4271 domain-containing protein [Saprospiraceae bacterium]